jgi:hypothetical protein
MSCATPFLASVAAWAVLLRLFSTRCAVSLNVASTSLLGRPVAAAICSAVFGSFKRCTICSTLPEISGAP